LTCQELHEQISAYVDNRVDAVEYRRKIEQHISYCPECRAAYQAELATKMVVRDRYSRMPASESLRRNIAGSLDSLSALEREEAERARPPLRRGDWIDRFAADYLSPTGIVVALLLVLGGAGLIVLFPRTGQSPVLSGGTGGPVVDTAAGGHSQNFFNKAEDNFQAIVDGKLHLQLATQKPEELQQYFKQNGVGYDVRFTQVRAPLAGGVVSQHGKTRFAHMVYTSGDTILYVFEVPHDALVRGDIVYVTSDVLERLDKGEDIWIEPMPNRSLVMIKRDGVMMAVAGNVPKATLQQFLALP
jgi:hypothetical protein